MSLDLIREVFSDRDIGVFTLAISGGGALGLLRLGDQLEQRKNSTCRESARRQSMDSNAIKIRQTARDRGITALYHFAALPNVTSILTHGLASRLILKEHRISYRYTDELRADGRPGALSVSIQSINESMFGAKLRNSRCPWAILEIDPSVLWTHDCRFCWSNAASAPIRDHTRFLGGPWGFDRMFEDCPVSAIDPRSSRETFDTPDNLPTLNDAEVQVVTPILPDLIVDVTVATESDKGELEAWMAANDRVRRWKSTLTYSRPVEKGPPPKRGQLSLGMGE